MRKKTRETLSLCLDVLIPLIVLAAWGRMLFRLDGTGQLTAMGLRSLRYFTVLSNLLAAFAALCSLFCRVRRRELTVRLVLLRYAAAASVGLTFLTVLLFLGPLFGYRSMYRGANFWFHLAVPVLSAADFCLSQGPLRFSLRQSLWAVEPMLLYGFGYVANILINGREGNDWYGFLTWGFPVGVGIFAVLILLTWGLGRLLILASRRLGKVPSA